MPYTVWRGLERQIMGWSRNTMQAAADELPRRILRISTRGLVVMCGLQCTNQ